MRIVYIPLDERPCNTDVVYQIVATNNEIKLLVPDKEYLGYKKNGANTKKLWEWLHKIEAVDGIILSTEMMLYGGLIPSRVHNLTEETVQVFEENLRKLKRNSTAKIYASSVIMRTPQYNSSDEEPDYYEKYGYAIFRSAYLTDKNNRVGASEEELKELDIIKETLPRQYKEDYEERRQFNSSVNKRMLKMLKEEVVDFLVIPQDDSSEFGYTAQDQSSVREIIEELELEENVHMYPGSDEVGATLVTRLYHDSKKIKPRVFVEWSSTLGAQLIPLYEDRPFNETLKRHVRAIGARLTQDSNQADIILAYNVPGKVMQESWDQFTQMDQSYESFRDIHTFGDEIENHLVTGKKVAIVDAAYANGGDYSLIKLLDRRNLIDKLVSYKGWNTNANSLGTTLSQGFLAQKEKWSQVQKNLHYHLLDDFIYQAVVRRKLVNEDLERLGLTYFDTKSQREKMDQLRNKYLRETYKSMLVNFSKEIALEKVQSYSPWHRMFELGLQIEE